MSDAAIGPDGRTSDVSPAVLALAQTEVRAMTAARLALASAVLLAGGLVPGLHAGPAADPQPPAKPAPPAAESAPAGATVIGSTQFRHVGWHSRAFLPDDGKTLLVVGEGVSVR